jgi:hypothetical protein
VSAGLAMERRRSRRLPRDQAEPISHGHFISARGIVRSRREHGISGELANEANRNPEAGRDNAKGLHKTLMHWSRYPGGGLFGREVASHTTVHVLAPFNKPDTWVLCSGLCLAAGFSLGEDVVPF